LQYQHLWSCTFWALCPQNNDVEAWVSWWLQSMPWTRRKRWSELVELYCRLLLQVCTIHSSSFLAVCFYRHPFEVLLWQVHEWQQSGIYH
jgi:hypothetical protein